MASQNQCNMQSKVYHRLISSVLQIQEVVSNGNVVRVVVMAPSGEPASYANDLLRQEAGKISLQRNRDFDNPP